MKNLILGILVFSVIACMLVALWLSYFLYQNHAMTGTTFGIIAGLISLKFRTEKIQWTHLGHL